MGVDMMLYVVVDEDYELKQETVDRFAAVTKLGWPKSKAPALEFHKGWQYPGETDFAHHRVQVNTVDRYFNVFSPKYYTVWPNVVESVMALQVLFPGMTICYGGDSLHYAPELTAARFQALNAFWAQAFKEHV